MSTTSYDPTASITSNTKLNFGAKDESKIEELFIQYNRRYQNFLDR